MFALYENGRIVRFIKLKELSSIIGNKMENGVYTQPNLVYQDNPVELETFYNDVSKF